MTGPRTQRKPTFFWQGLLILLPVAVLAVIGLISLRQDKIIARHDAAERAQVIADDLVAKIWNELTAEASSPLNLASGPAFEVDQAGQLMFPPAFIPVPLPKPLDPAELNAGQTQLWLKLQGADASRQNSGAVIQAFRDVIGSHPPERFAAAACYNLGLVLAQQGKNAEAAEMFDRVVKKYAEAVGESGLPLQPLARLKWLQLAAAAPDIAGTNPVSIDSLCSNVVFHPTLLTPELLKQAEMLPAPGGQAEAEKWRRIWQDQELARGLYSMARRNFYGNVNPAPSSFPLVSAEAGETVTNVLFPRLFWFDTITLWPVPTASGRATQNWDSLASATRSKVVISSGLTLVGRDWLAIGLDGHETNHWFVCRGESEIVSRLNELVNREQPVPDYLGIGIEVARHGIRALDSNLRVWRYVGWNSPHSPGGGMRKEYSGEVSTNILASAVKSEAVTELLKVNVYLTSPEALYQRQGARAFWFGLLVAASTVAALIGLLTAWGVFRQQRQLSELKSNFVSSVSHELRAPIASVRLMAENLEGGKIPEPQKQKEYFGFIVQECRRLTSLIENVLDFSRIEQGRKQYEFEPTDVLALLRQTVTLMQPNAAEKGVALKLETSNAEHRTPNIELEIDGRAIQQALVNLIDNAIKHSPKGETVTVGVEVQSPKPKAQSPTTAAASVEDEGRDRIDKSLNPQPPGATKRSEGGSTLNLSVSDHGPGIPPAEHEKIFERFYRRGSELRRETQGVGIGLSLVKHIIAAHGGRVRVESEPGQGSRFVIELPIRT